MHVARAKDLNLYLYSAISASLILGLAAGLMLTTFSPSLRFTVAIAVTTALLGVSAIPLFVSGIKNFKVELKSAYIILCFGIGIFAIAQIQIPIVNIFGFFFWLESGAVAAVYIFGIVPMLLAMRKFAKTLNIRSIWKSVTLCITVALATIVPTSFLPHIKVESSELLFDVFQGIIVWNIAFVLFAGMLSLIIQKNISDIYKKSINWLAAAFFTLVVAGMHFFVVRLLVTDGNWYFDYSFAIIPFGLGALAFLVAGYKISSTNVIETTNKNEQASQLDIITFVASLVSKPDDIDLIIDEVRGVSAQINPNESLNDTQKQVLSKAYTQLQEYLATKDAVRAYTEDELLQTIFAKFGKQNLQDISFLKENRNL